jgi:hypothetical protein
VITLTVLGPKEAADWPDPLDQQPELPCVPEFNVEHLPIALRGLVDEVSVGMQVPSDYPACASVASLAGCVSHRAMVLPKSLDST